MAAEFTVVDVGTGSATCRFDKPTQIVIPFQSLLLQITKHLHFPTPKYEIVDVKTNSVVVLVYTDSGREAYTFKGGPCESLESSCQRAAQIAVWDCMKRFNVWVEDISISKRREFERCGALYRLKRQELRYLRKGIVGGPLIERLGTGVPIGSEPVIIDYTSILRLIVRKCGMESSELETVSHGRSKYTAWITITLPKTIWRRKTFYSICCDCVGDAKNSLAKTVIEFLIPICNLEIVDANYNPKLTAYAAILSALEMESYIASKERLMGIELATAVPRMLPVKRASKTSSYNLKLPSMISIPAPPPQRPFKTASMQTSLMDKMQNGKRKKFRIPGELGTVSKRARHIYIP